MSQKIITPKTPTGTMELLPREQMAFQAMLDTIRRGYERYGFTPIETPVFEEVDILLTKSGGDTEKQVYFAQSTGSLKEGHKPDLALRFDLTVPLARYVAQHQNELAFPFRRYQIQRVYRGERAQKGRFREFYQCDIDIIGRDTLSPAYDAEVPVVIAGIFRELNIGKFTIHVSNRKILKGYLDSIGVTSDDGKAAVLREIDKADKIGWDEVITNLENLGHSSRLLNFVGMLNNLSERKKESSAADDVVNYHLSRNSVDTLRKLCADAPEALNGLDEIEILLDAAVSSNIQSVLYFNPTITRGLDYYTGTVYETFLDEFKNFGSICSGGRYENLASYYTRSKLPGVGISIGATRLFEQMRQSGLVKAPASHVQVLVAHMDSALDSDLRRIATDLRSAGINTDMYLEGGKLEKQIKYAEKAGIPLLLVYGENEKAKGVAALKNLQAREQKDVPVGDLKTAIKDFFKNV
jgi:histidyl-tRNA synthetase